MDKNIAIIAYASGEPYLSEAYNLKVLCDKSNIKFILYTFEWLKKTDFYKQNKKLLNSKKSGYCAWKPYIILDALETYDKVLYLDSSMLFNPEIVLGYINSDKTISATETPLLNSLYTKKETFKIMNCDSEEYWDSKQVWAGNVLVDKSKKHIIEEWLYYCKQIDCINDNYNYYYDKDVRYHLFDQSILSILFKKHNIEKQNNIVEDKSGRQVSLFCDTREFAHREYILHVFGENAIKNQDYLIEKYGLEYRNNSSCFYPLEATQQLQVKNKLHEMGYA
jgi:hypothetical protein